MKEGVICCSMFVWLLAGVFFISCYSTGYGGLEYCPHGSFVYVFAVIAAFLTCFGCCYPTNLPLIID